MLGLEGTSGVHLVQPLLKQVPPEQVVHPGRVCISPREGDSTAPVGSMFQGFVTLSANEILVIFRWNFLCFSCGYCPVS